MPFVESSERLNVSMVKSQSRRLVFRHIFRHGPVTRAEIAQETGLSQGTVKTVVDEFLASGILTETKDASAQVGRKPLKVLLRREARTFGVLNIQPDRTEMHLLDLSLQPTGIREQFATGRSDEYQTRLERFLGRVAIPASDAGELAAVGIVVPGIYNEADDRVICHIMPELARVPLRDSVEPILKVPVAIGEDVHLAALAEVGDPYRVSQPLFYFYAESGVGGAYLAQGSVLEGATNMAGEIGQIYIDGTDRLEDLVRWPRFAREAGVSATIDSNDAARLVMRKLTAGDPVAKAALNDVCTTIATALNHAVCILNPRSIVIGGPYGTMGEAFLGPLRELLFAKLIPEHRDGLEVLAARSGDHGMIRGAALTALEQWLDTAFTSGETS